jgi:cardiolipin synthase
VLAGATADVKTNLALGTTIVRFFGLWHILILLLLALIYFPEDAARWLELSAYSSAAFVLLLVLFLATTGLFRDSEGVHVGTLGLANKLTLFRFVLVVPVTVLIIHHRLFVALVLYAIGGLTDILDGIAARRHGESTQFGVMMDPTADILATTGVFVALYVTGLVPWWVLAVLLARYITLGLGSLVLTFTTGPIKFRATRTGKIVGVLQAAAVILIVALTAAGVEWRERLGAYIYPFLAVIFGTVMVSKLFIAVRHIRERTTNVRTQG